MDKTKQKIQELVPEIMELKFGCEIKSYCHPAIDIVIDDFSEIDSLVGGKYATHERKNLEILGRPITLAETIEAVKRTENARDGDWLEVCKNWKYGTLEDQTPALIEHIYSVLIAL